MRMWESTYTHTCAVCESLYGRDSRVRKRNLQCAQRIAAKEVIVSIVLTHISLHASSRHGKASPIFRLVD